MSKNAKSPMRSASVRPLDDTDRRIIGLLRAEPRMLNKELAEALGVAEPTAAAKVRALEAEGVIRISAQCDYRALGYNVLASVDVGVRQRPLTEVSEDLAAIDNVAIITIVMGERPLMLLVVAQSLSELHDTVARKIAHVAGVASVETAIISDIVKYRAEFAALRTGAPS